MDKFGWALAILNIGFGILNTLLAFNGFLSSFVIGVINLLLGGWILMLVLKD